jgi:hypothetical protein
VYQRSDRAPDEPSQAHASSTEETSQISSANAGAPALQALRRQQRAEPRALSDVLASWAHATTNPDFTQEMKSYLEETARAVNLDPRLVDSADCRGNICRVKLVFATPESALAFQDAANPSADYTVYVAGAEQMDPSVRPGASPALDVTIERALPPTAANVRPESEP